MAQQKQKLHLESEIAPFQASVKVPVGRTETEKVSSKVARGVRWARVMAAAEILPPPFTPLPFLAPFLPLSFRLILYSKGCSQAASFKSLSRFMQPAQFAKATRSFLGLSLCSFSNGLFVSYLFFTCRLISLCVRAG